MKKDIVWDDFETGFPIDFGGTRRILELNVLEGGWFVLREGNNLSPHIPFENPDAMYQTARSLA